MATQLSVINLAFAHLSEPVVQTLEGDPRPPSVAKALAQWDQAVDTALATAPWLCATESLTLDRDVEPGNWRYPYRFTCPSGTLKVWNVEGEGFAWQAATIVETGGAVRHVIRAAVAGPLYVDVIMRRTVEAMPPLLIDALAWELAARLAGPIQSSESKSKWAAEKAEGSYARAAAAEATEIGGQDPLFSPGALTWARLQAG